MYRVLSVPIAGLMILGAFFLLKSYVYMRAVFTSDSLETVMGQNLYATYAAGYLLLALVSAVGVVFLTLWIGVCSLLEQLRKMEMR